MSEKIFVTMTLASGLPGQDFGSFQTNRIDVGHHLVLHYVNKRGKHFKIEAVPQKKINTTLQKGWAAIKEELITFGETNTDSDFGSIKVESGPGIKEELSRDRETITEGPDLSHKWRAIVSSFRKIHLNYEYRPYSQNSNTTVNHALRANGLRIARGVSDSGKTYQIIGADKELKNPIKPLERKINDQKRSEQNLKPNINDTPLLHEKPPTSYADAAKPFQEKRVQLAAPGRAGANRVSDNRLLNADEMPQKGPERVKRDPGYNPFNREKNGFEDLDGEVAVWKKGKDIRNKMIIEAGREKFFGIDAEETRSLGSLPQKGPERVKRDPGYNPFHRDKNGFEDLDGEVAVWKKGKAVRNRMIREAGRADFFGIDEEAA